MLIPGALTRHYCSLIFIVSTTATSNAMSSVVSKHFSGHSARDWSAKNHYSLYRSILIHCNSANFECMGVCIVASIHNTIGIDLHCSVSFGKCLKVQESFGNGEYGIPGIFSVC